MPDYTFKCWSEKEIDIQGIPFAKGAYNAGKYAYVADYTRIYALYHEGGIYMDTDILLKTRFDDFLKYGVFTSYEFAPSRKDMPKVRAMLTPDGERVKKRRMHPYSRNRSFLCPNWLRERPSVYC